MNYVKKLPFISLELFSLKTNNLTYQGGRYEPSSPLTNHLHARSLPRSQAQLTEWLTLFSPSKKVPTVQLNFLLREFFPRRKKRSFFVGSAENVAETSTGAENGPKRPKTAENGPKRSPSEDSRMALWPLETVIY